MIRAEARLQLQFHTLNCESMINSNTICILVYFMIQKRHLTGSIFHKFDSAFFLVPKRFCPKRKKLSVSEISGAFYKFQGHFRNFIWATSCTYIFKFISLLIHHSGHFFRANYDVIISQLQVNFPLRFITRATFSARNMTSSFTNLHILLPHFALNSSLGPLFPREI